MNRFGGLAIRILVIFGLMVGFIVIGMAVPAWADICTSGIGTNNCECSGVSGPYPHPDGGQWWHGTCRYVTNGTGAPMTCVSRTSENGPWICSGDADSPDPINICDENGNCICVGPEYPCVPATLTVEANTPVLYFYNQTYISVVDGITADENHELRTLDTDPERLSLVVGFYDTVGIGATVTVTAEGPTYETEGLD